jgi:DNA (cytosine-5)-methyltransferase 1
MIGMTVCSGIGAPECAAPWIDWKYQSEIEPFPSAVLKHRFPDAVNLGDMTKFKEWPDATINVLCGGTPCQSFSVAGLRKGLADPRGNLMLTYLAIADRYRPEWLVWENVPGVLSSNGGRDFGSLLGGLGQLGYGFAYRVLDAQYVRVESHPRAVPQRRRRVFVVGCLGGWQRAAAVLFERESLSGHPAPRREAGKGTSRGFETGPNGGGRGVERGGDTRGQDPVIAVASTGDIAHCLNAGGMGRIDYETDTMIAHTLKGEGFDAGEDGTGRGTPIVPVVFNPKMGGNPTMGMGVIDDGSVYTIDTDGMSNAIAFDSKGTQVQTDTSGTAPTLRSMSHDGSHQNGGGQLAVEFAQNTRDEVRLIGGDGQSVGALAAEPGMKQQAYVATPMTLAIRGRGDSHNLEYREDGTANAVLTPNGGRGGIGVGAIAHGWAVRRLTPTECERLQGFPDGWTAIEHRGKPAADGPRYKALGNSMAVNVMTWIFERIRAVSEISRAA